jgi:CheY-like chemotaxis protein/class 3 adenylate cyclase
MEQKINLLLVDDNKENLKVLSGFLKNHGYNIALAFDGKTAIEIAQRYKIGLILIDIMMPEIDGFETFDILRNNELTKDIPVVFLTAKTGTEDIVRAFKMGGADYITKPYIKEELLARVNNHVERREYRESLKESINSLREYNTMLDNLLLNVLPAKVAQDFKENGKSEPRLYEDVTIFVSDFVNFTSKTSRMESKVFFNELNELYTGFDLIMKTHGCERIKTVGDAYLAVCGMTKVYPDNAARMVAASMEIVRFLLKRNSESLHQWEARIGIHSGEITGGIVGTDKFIFDIFGTAVNTAFRLESLSEPNRINISESTYKLVSSRYNFTERQPIPVKGIDDFKMYFINM